jgi:DNA-binding PadR family transcriptional regulator
LYQIDIARSSERLRRMYRITDKGLMWCGVRQRDIQP